MPLYVVREAGANFIMHVRPDRSRTTGRTGAWRRALATSPEPTVEALNARVERAVLDHPDPWFMRNELRPPAA
mgnify:CR=1 FL=1